MWTYILISDFENFYFMGVLKSYFQSFYFKVLICVPIWLVCWFYIHFYKVINWPANWFLCWVQDENYHHRRITHKALDIASGIHKGDGIICRWVGWFNAFDPFETSMTCNENVKSIIRKYHRRSTHRRSKSSINYSINPTLRGLQ